MQYLPILSIQDLKNACLSEEGDYVHFRMILAGGLAFSSKRILYDSENNTFSIINEIDESELDDLTENQLETETMIVEAIKKNAFFQSVI